MCEPCETFEHILLDISTQKCHVIRVTREMKQKIESDETFASAVLDALKNIEKGENKENNCTSEESVGLGDFCADDQTDYDNFDIEDEFMKKKEFSKTEEVKAKGSCSSITAKIGKYTWEYDDTKASIQSYASHVDELDNPTHRKFFWENIANDLVSQKFHADKDMCNGKWNNLLRSSKQCKDKTSRAPTSFLFFTEMDEILGDRPIVSGSHTLSSLKKKADRDLRNESNSDFCNQDIPDITGELHSHSDPSKSEKCNKRKGLELNEKKKKKENSIKISTAAEKIGIGREEVGCG